MFAEINAKLDTLEAFEERLTIVEATREPPESPTGDQTPPRNNRRNNTDNSPNPDAQYLKNIKIDVPNFDGYYDPQFFINWVLQLDRYFALYEFTEPRKVKYAIMKLSG